MIKKSKNFGLISFILLVLSFGFYENVEASSTSIHVSFTQSAKPVLTGVYPTRTYPYLYTTSQLYDAQARIALGNDESFSNWITTVTGGTATFASLGSLIDENGNAIAPVKLYMKNKTSTALNIYQGTFVY